MTASQSQTEFLGEQGTLLGGNYQLSQTSSNFKATKEGKCSDKD
jgi:hypothetical protein